MIPLDGDRLATVMLAAGVALLTWTMLRMYLRRSRRTRSAAQPASRVAAARTEPRDIPPDVLRWQVETHELIREMKAELDSKMHALEILVALADQKTRELEALLTELETARRQSD